MRNAGMRLLGWLLDFRPGRKRRRERRRAMRQLADATVVGAALGWALENPGEFSEQVRGVAAAYTELIAALHEHTSGEGS